MSNPQEPEDFVPPFAMTQPEWATFQQQQEDRAMRSVPYVHMVSDPAELGELPPDPVWVKQDPPRRDSIYERAFELSHVLVPFSDLPTLRRIHRRWRRVAWVLDIIALLCVLDVFTHGVSQGRGDALLFFTVSGLVVSAYAWFVGVRLYWKHGTY